MITIKKVYTWYNVYNNHTLILKNLNKIEKNDIIKVLKDTKTDYKIIDTKL